MNDMKQQLSACMDGELDLNDNPHLLTILSKNDDLDQVWKMYHLIGDALRHDTMLSRNLTASTMQQLKSEAVVLAPKRHIMNQWLSHHYAGSLAASITAVAFVGWAIWQAQGIPSTTPQIVVQSSLQVATKDSLPVETFNQYMLAHHEYASGNAMQYASDVKTVSYTESGN